MIYAYLFDSFKTECEKNGITVDLEERINNIPGSGSQCYLYKDRKSFYFIVQDLKGHKIVFSPDVLEVESIMNVQIIGNLEPLYKND